MFESNCILHRIEHRIKHHIEHRIEHRIEHCIEHRIEHRIEHGISMPGFCFLDSSFFRFTLCCVSYISSKVLLEVTNKFTKKSSKNTKKSTSNGEE